MFSVIMLAVIASVLLSKKRAPARRWMTPLESAFRVAPLSNQLPQVQPARQTLPWLEIWEIHKFKVITVAFESQGWKGRSYIQPINLNELSDKPVTYKVFFSFWDQVQGSRVEGLWWSRKFQCGDYPSGARWFHYVKSTLSRLNEIPEILRSGAAFMCLCTLSIR